MEEKKTKLVDTISEKGRRSKLARKRTEQEVLDRKFKEFVISQDKKFNVQRIARKQHHDRQLLDQKIQEDNYRSEKIRREREEIMITKQKLRKEIDKDKQLILQDFEMIKQGKAEPGEVAKKYGYIGKSSGEGGSPNNSSSRINAAKRTYPNIHNPQPFSKTTTGQGFAAKQGQSQTSSRLPAPQPRAQSHATSGNIRGQLKKPEPPRKELQDQNRSSEELRKRHVACPQSRKQRSSS